MQEDQEDRQAREQPKILQLLMICSTGVHIIQCTSLVKMVLHLIRLTILKKNLSFRSWKSHYAQQLYPDDCDKKMEHVEMFLTRHNDWPELFENTLWSNEVVFYVGGVWHHYWDGRESAHICVEKAHNFRKTPVSRSIISSSAGRFIFRITVNAKRYLETLQDRVWPLVSQ